MSVSSRAGKYLSKLKKDPDAYVRSEAEFRAKSVETGGMSKKELNDMLKSKDENDTILAKAELERRASNREIKQSLAKDVKEGKVSETKAAKKYQNKKQNPISGESARDSATKAKDRVYGNMDDSEDFAKGGMVTKKKAPAKAKAKSTFSIKNNNFGK